MGEIPVRPRLRYGIRPRIGLEWVKMLAEMEAQRDECVAACEALIIWMTHQTDNFDAQCPLCKQDTSHEPDCPYSKAKAAIARAKGESDA